MAKKSDFKNKTKEEIEKLLSEKRLALKGFRFGIAGSKVKNMKEGGDLKREIARMITAINGMKLKN